MDHYRRSTPSYLCDLQIGNCTDRVSDNSNKVSAWMNVNITVADCDYVNNVQMVSESQNCETRNPKDRLIYDNRYYISGAFSCRVSSNDPCVWDGGVFDHRDQLLIATGATAASLWIVTFVPAVTLISILCKDYRDTWSFKTKA
jgi:hypothetical protein